METRLFRTFPSTQLFLGESSSSNITKCVSATMVMASFAMRDPKSTIENR